MRSLAATRWPVGGWHLGGDVSVPHRLQLAGPTSGIIGEGPKECDDEKGPLCAPTVAATLLTPDDPSTTIVVIHDGGLGGCLDPAGTVSGGPLQSRSHRTSVAAPTRCLPGRLRPTTRIEPGIAAVRPRRVWAAQCLGDYVV
jgi:hypothetical protein